MKNYTTHEMRKNAARSRLELLSSCYRPEELNMKVSLCVNTYRRSHIYETLMSAWNQELGKDIEIELIVSDNDEQGSGRPHVDRFAQDTGAHVNYNIVPEKNIAIARNDAVRRASGEWIVFLDDDEIAPSRWLATLLECANSHNADLVQGRVISTFAPGVEPWIVKADPMSKYWGPTGTRLRFASTCNLLVRASLLKATPSPFNPRFGKMGNDDGEMSFRLMRSGARIIACSEKPVTEMIPADRGNVTYLKARNRGFGQAYLYLVKEHLSPFGMVRILVTTTVNVCVYFLASEILGAFNRSRWLKLRIRYWINIGKMDYFLNAPKIENY